ncbi:unnamed protein product, partial [Effrenium voratum]
MAHKFVHCGHGKAASVAGRLTGRAFGRKLSVRSSGTLASDSKEVLTDYAVRKLWEEDGLVAIHKPWGMRVYLPRDEQGQRYRCWPEEVTVHDALREMLPCTKIRLVHRLDYATGGLMLAATSKKAAAEAWRLFKERRVAKVYVALVLGWPPWQHSLLRAGLLDGPEGAFARRAVSAGTAEEAEAETAETDVRVLKRGMWPK